MNLSKAPGLKRDGLFLRRVAASKEAAKCVIRSKEHVGFAPQAATRPRTMRTSSAAQIDARSTRTLQALPRIAKRRTSPRASLVV